MICVCSHIVTDLHFGANITKQVLSVCFFWRKSTLRTSNLGGSKYLLQKFGKLGSKCRSVAIDRPILGYHGLPRQFTQAHLWRSHVSRHRLRLFTCRLKLRMNFRNILTDVFIMFIHLWHHALILRLEFGTCSTELIPRANINIDSIWP